MKNKNYEKVCSTKNGKLQFFKQTPMKVKKKRIVKDTPINYIEDVSYITNSKKRQAIAKVCKIEKWKSEKNNQLSEIQEFCKTAEEFLYRIADLSTVEMDTKISIK
jgi:hypothetical protein